MPTLKVWVQIYINKKKLYYIYIYIYIYIYTYIYNMYIYIHISIYPLIALRPILAHSWGDSCTKSY